MYAKYLPSAHLNWNGYHDGTEKLKPQRDDQQFIPRTFMRVKNIPLLWKQKKEKTWGFTYMNL